MRKRVMLFVAPLCVVAIAASVAVASPSDAEHSRDSKRANPHAVRPIAATSSVLDPSALAAVEVAEMTTYLNTYVRQAQLQQYLDQLTLQAYLDAVASVSPIRAAGSQRYVSSSGSGDFLSCVRNRESGGNYTIYNSGGSGAAGAYQFLPGTWNSIAGSTDRSDLVGVDPAQASSADQDAMAQALYAQQGAAPWGGGC